MAVQKKKKQAWQLEKIYYVAKLFKQKAFFFFFVNSN